MLRLLIAAVLGLLMLQACVADSPGQQCMNSFKSEFKDPESGRVISFKDSNLVYTATNSYGARVQGRAMCKQIGSEWHRDRRAEHMQILDRSIETLNALNACTKGGKPLDECAGDSLALKLKRPGSAVDIDALHQESTKALGF